MKEVRNKIVAILYILLVSAIFIGWYPQVQAEPGRLYTAASQLGTAVESMCLLEENDQLFWQGVAETSEEARRENEQMDEEYRRATTEIRKLKPKKIKEIAAVSASAESRRILERIVEAEAGDQDLKGRVLVANVVLNRVKSKNFPNSVKRVVFAHRQFSPISNGSYYSVSVSSTTRKAVQAALDGRDYSRGALYFMCRSASSPSNVSWFDRDLTRLFKYGCHEFYR